MPIRNTFRPLQLQRELASMNYTNRLHFFRELRQPKRVKSITLLFKLNCRKLSKKRSDLSSSSRRKLLSSRLSSKSTSTMSEISKPRLHMKFQLSSNNMVCSISRKAFSLELIFHQIKVSLDMVLELVVKLQVHITLAIPIIRTNTMIKITRVSTMIKIIMVFMELGIKLTVLVIPVDMVLLTIQTTSSMID